MAKNINWSISLEHDEYENNLELVIHDAVDAVEETTLGHYVNLVTPEGFGHPKDYLIEALATIFENKITMKFIDQCGCGGYVLQVWKE
ncbi:CGCGG family rSAM-modified RiPP protein [Mesobacillus maritimus]|uniref:CGCGG family rSAM-modified RiPP protein n=1 Tax=Mesobacillus maritimus TaxID=1643336 RepID=A0ABS7K8H1_9BACI|nr:CGCGG family rSAM-modified RiPP protein [Mesobacillus maritimus]MBY0098567.1 CGCGG family rSAM-modified RiPP protein [Mesobacillus maritimus]